MVIKSFCIIFLLAASTYSFAAKKDSLSHTQSSSLIFKKQILPLSLITAGALLNIGDIKQTLQDKVPNASTSFDDYCQYAPMAQLYLGNILGIKHQNTVFDQTKYLLISQLTSGILVYTLKRITDVERPWQGTGSFPSAHTNKIFVGATVLFYEYKDTAPALAYSGFLLAAATAYLRVAKDGHWVPDVVFSAGLGILTVNLVYYFEPLKNWQPFKRKDLALTPILSPNSIGIYCCF